MIENDVSQLLRIQEALEPELQMYLYEDGVFGTCIKHPLVFSVVHTEQLNAMVNAQLKFKKKALAKARKEADWSQVIWLHERAYRLDALQEVGQYLDEQAGGAEFWGLAGEVWTDSENIWQNLEEWRDIFCDYEFWDREYFMSEHDRQTLRLPVNKGGMEQQVTVYRGFCHDEAVDGFSWSLNRDTAVWFAQRAVCSDVAIPKVAKGTLSKRDVIGLMTGRGELEIVALPENVCGIEIAEVQ